MGARLTDSEQYAHLWGSAEVRALLDERSRLQTWLDILVALAAAQARLGIIPATAAEAIRVGARADRLDLDVVAAETRRTSHSMLGVIRALQDVLPADAFDHVYVGATVQDVTDTWFALLIRDLGAIVWRDLWAAEGALLDLARRHRGTLMPGRTHGQVGSPITFGVKAASWADEVRRHLDRLREGRSRWLVGQLGGAVGVLGWFEPDGTALRAAFCAELGLGDPGISWLTSRDRIAEFGAVLALVTGTMARIGTEVYELQRPEIGELHEPTTPGTVGSMTMPHKRNPEAGEHLDTLARLVRAQSAVLIEGVVAAHERDGRAWKAEWVALPEAGLLASTSVAMGRHLVEGLVVDEAAMTADVHRYGDAWSSEQLLAGLTRRVGKHTAQRAMHEALAPGSTDVRAVSAAVVAAGLASAADCRAWTAQPALTAAGDMVDTVVARATAARATESGTWA